MVDLILVAVLVAWLAFVFCVGQALRMLGGWKPAVARVWLSDYGEAQQREDFWSFGMTMFTSRGWNWRDAEDSRLIEDEIVFTTADGREQRALVKRQVHRGWRPRQVYPIWYDPADPARVTVLGPLYWAVMALLAIATTAMLVPVVQELGLPPMLAKLFG